MRKRPMSGGHGGHSNGQGGMNRKFHHRSNSGGSGGHSQGGNRPRKNYAALREKYINQARDALSSGDRVLAENYYQHADHCYRMIAEENERRGQYQQQQQATNPEMTQQEQDASFEMQDNAADELPPASTSSALPAFLTQPVPQGQPAAPVAADWEES